MNIRLFLPFALFEVLIIIKTISCFHEIVENPEVPCGLRYNNLNAAKILPPPLGKSISGRSLTRAIEAQALDERLSTGNDTTTLHIEQQKARLGRMLLKLKQMSAPFDGHIRESYLRLLKDSRRVLGKSNDFSTQIDNAKKMTSRNQEDLILDNAKVENQIRETRDLLTKIEKNLMIKTRIIGGKQASIKEFPWLVSIQVFQGSHICGGSIISPEWILTAAHCVADEKTNEYIDRRYVIGVGSSLWRKGVLYDVVKVVKHPGFTFKEYRHDISLMKVEPAINFVKGKVVPICLPPKGVEVYGTATIAGWGLTHNDNKHPNDFLMRANIEILNDGYCSRRYGNYNRNQMICAGRLNGEKDSCQGDSGGPMQCLLQDGRIYLMGAVSFGDKCGRVSFPGVYTKQTNYVDWVYAQILEDKRVIQGRSLNTTEN